ncbi:MAG: Zn-dependent exopeptidase M28 [Chloroflexi bacterium]|nr:Zn-dependent exopeptidase M28 [Chloroflexota bacterium]MBM3182843.1 Zn-dependent exopeptidase M28 [Chloroflexota bacterium]MBM4453585.1 Zn-dependent exopeptidase M28 [Chloroflexota bacterium]
MGKNKSEPEITRDNVQHVFNLTDEIVERYPNRLTGTRACLETAMRLKEEFSRNCDHTSVDIEEFTCRPKSFLKYIPVIVIIGIICSFLLLFRYPVPALIGFALVIFAFYGQFVRYWHLLDPLFPKARGYNIHGRIEPEGRVKQQVILSAHHDAAYVFQLIAHMPRFYSTFMQAGILFLVVGFLVSLIWTALMLFNVPPPAWAHPSIPLALVICSILVLPLAFFTTGQVSPGAGDNMIAVAITNEVARLFQDARKAGTNALQHTRLMVVSFDAEEAGLRGARAFCKKHKEELLSTKTYVFNIDTLYKVKDINFFAHDLNTTVKLSRQVAQDCADIAHALGYPAVVSGMPFGGGSTDAAAFGEIGVEATNMAAMSFDVSAFGKDMVYHTKNDLTKYIEPEVVEAALKIARNYILKKDAQA